MDGGDGANIERVILAETLLFFAFNTYNKLYSAAELALNHSLTGTCVFKWEPLPGPTERAKGPGLNHGPKGPPPGCEIPGGRVLPGRQKKVRELPCSRIWELPAAEGGTENFGRELPDKNGDTWELPSPACGSPRPPKAEPKILGRELPKCSGSSPDVTSRPGVWGPSLPQNAGFAAFWPCRPPVSFLIMSVPRVATTLWCPILRKMSCTIILPQHAFSDFLHRVLERVIHILNNTAGMTTGMTSYNRGSTFLYVLDGTHLVMISTSDISILTSTLTWQKEYILTSIRRKCRELPPHFQIGRELPPYSLDRPGAPATFSRYAGSSRPILQ
ncbi:hypothetical protein C8J57DRAFT_1250636 [Mycena rebaudengoi]|nr:hypothetical protein C8J57DRAFT_1250636 [Mycena rebaudengoi]